MGRAILDAFERYDGLGVPGGRAADEITLAARFAAVGFTAVMFDSAGGAKVAAQTVAQWSGRALDPAVTAVFLDAPDELLRACDPDDLWAAVVDCEPQPGRVFRDDAALDDALAGFGDAADLKSPWFTGHSGGVARLAQARRRISSSPPRPGWSTGPGWSTTSAGSPSRPASGNGPVRCGRRTGSWSGCIPITAAASWHALRCSRRSARSSAAITSAPTAPATRPGSPIPGWTSAACLLAAADAFHALGEPRPHRPAVGRAEAARILSGMPLDRRRRPGRARRRRRAAPHCRRCPPA